MHVKKAVIFFVMLICCHHNYAQWVSVLSLNPQRSFQSVSAPTDKNIWAITSDFIVYNTTNGGTTWNKFQAKGFGSTANLSIYNLFAINSSVALLSMDSIFTGNGPGFIYRTTDGGRNWTKVFSHTGNCNIKMGMFNNNAGLASCTFSNSLGQTNQQLFFTTDGGKSWKLDPINPSADIFIYSFAINGLQAAMSDVGHVYFSNNEGRSWTNTAQNISVDNLQFKDSSYAMGSSNLGLMVKRPHKQWQQSEADSLLMQGLISGLVLDNNECWVAEGLDKIDNYYSADSGKTFTNFRADSTKGFVMMTKARNGKTILGVTPPFGGSAIASLWINARQQNNFVSNNENIKRANDITALLQQNIPNSFSSSTTISYTLPQQYSSAKIIITGRNGNIVKQVNLSNKDKGIIQVDASSFMPGIYEYSLIVDGKLISTKQMMIIK
jgi:photosystem II stability/assembly factor-like uncharacterized protein